MNIQICKNKYISACSAKKENCANGVLFNTFTTFYVQYSTPLKIHCALLTKHVMFEQEANIQPE